MRRERAGGPGIVGKIVSYFAGLSFALISYAVGVWAYSVEAAAVGETGLPSPWQQIRSLLPQHPFTLLGWTVVVTGLSVTIGYLFDREVYFRRRAEQKANVDGLTGVYNHRYFQDRLSAEVERAQRYGRKLSLVILDLDDFKAFNDHKGHQEGDLLLQCFAELCRSIIRAMDVLARYGGDEFVIILPETGPEEARAVGDRIRESLSQSLHSKFSGFPSVTVSAGLAACPQHGQTRHALILNADTALYHAKQNGKDRIEIYDDSHKKAYRTTPDRLKALLEDSHMEAIEALSAAVDAKDHYTRGHSDAVTRYSLALAEKLGFSGSETENLKAAALLHDIGKIGTPDSILRKPGPLQMDEWQVIEDHPKVGSEILEKVQQLGSIVPGVRHHHERYDGLGYPAGLSGKSIPLIARIIALADAYDAMVSKRTYRDALPREEALEELRRCAGTQFDPELVDIFIQIIEERDRREGRQAA